MKFYSVQSRYTLVLRPSIPGNPAMAVPMKPGISVVFHNNVCDRDEEDVIKLLLAHKSCGLDFFQEGTPGAERISRNIYRAPSPRHEMTDLSGQSQKAAVLSKEEVTKAAEEMLKAMLPALKEAWKAEQAPIAHPIVSESVTSGSEPKNDKKSKKESHVE